jgi:small subunit ribosomal protein S11
LSYSAGNIGFRKAQRGSFDAAFQLAAYVMRTISDKGLLRNASFAESSASGIGTRKLEAPIREMEVVLRGFGKGREAVTKALLGTEGRFLRERITSVSDDTKLKFGGTRGMNPRRLG